jgi:PAS domain S-box-containing protein
LKQKLSRNDENLSAAFALKEPGGFAIKMDYASGEVLTVSRQLAIVPWVLVRKISYGEALSKTESRIKTIFTVLVLIIVAVSVTLIAVWRHGTSLRAAQAAENYRRSSERFENLSRFMRIVTDSQPTQIAAVDEKGNYTFANRRAASEAGISTDDIVDKSMANVIGPIKAKVFADLNREALARAEPQSHVHHFSDETGEQVIKSDHIPLGVIAGGDAEQQNGVLMVLDDITELTQEKELSEERLRQLINTLVSVIDRRDPFSAHHSTRVAEVARGITLEMELSDLDTKTVDIAGSLMNLGKIYIPPNLLIKTGDLTEEERDLLSGSYATSAELLESVNFEGPAVDTIRQFTENWDGSGPLGLSGEEILSTARVLAVANSFVGMVSPRAYREALTFEKVSDIMLEQSGVKYDRKAVSALINILENRGGKERWHHFRDAPPEAG